MRGPLLPSILFASPLFVGIVGMACGTTPPPDPTVAGTPSVVPSAASKPSASASGSVAAVPSSGGTLRGADEAALDKSVDPCADFYAYACGGWMKKTPIPGDQPMWIRSFSEIEERNEKALDAVLERDAAGKGDPKDAYYQKLADFYAACMDESSIEKAGIEPLREAFAVVDKVKDAASFSAAVSELYKQGFSPLFSFYSGQDYADATQVIGQLEQGGLGLPDREYYLKKDEKSAGVRRDYQEHIGKMLGLAKLSADPKADAAAIVSIETELAKVSMIKADRRDPKKTYHRMQLAGLQKLAPSFGWGAFLNALSVAKTAPINVMQPDFIKGMEAPLSKVKPADWKTYLRWHVLHSSARTLYRAFVDEDFRFRSTALTGEEKILPRWKRCVRATDAALGEALAQPFVRDTFGAEGKETTSKMVADIEHAMERNLSALSWMDDATRAKAFEKLKKINNKIGFPAVWRNYDSLPVARSSYAKNVQAADAFELRRVLAKIGKPLDRNEWYMTPPQVNAYYDSNLNEMVFPAGILQTPFFDRKASLAVNYGAIGMVMGHELTHGFDDQGRKFDGDGNLKDWWTKDVGDKFDAKAGCVEKQFSDFTVGEPGKSGEQTHVDGKLTLGENIADLGGLKLAYAAMKETRKGAPKEIIGGFSEEQQFFLSFAQAWCTNTRPQFELLLVSVDPHSPPRYRVNGPISNLPEFAAAFSCATGTKMVRKDRCEVW